MNDSDAVATPLDASAQFAPGVYPSDLECDIVSRVGEKLHLRPIRPDDDGKLSDFHLRLSADSIYRRYFSMHPTLSSNELAHLTQVDYVDRLAFVIEDDQRLLAVARYERYPGTKDAEVAFIVADDHQRQGLGLLLVHHLADAARARGVTTLIGETLATNRDMVSVFLASGYPATTHTEGQEVTVRLSIADPDTDATEAAAPC